MTKKNACRALHRLIQSEGAILPLQIDAVKITVRRLKPRLGQYEAWWPIISMRTWATYLLQHHPGYLLGGNDLDNPYWPKMLKKFWDTYRSIDPQHAIYSSSLDTRYVVPYCFHGDEGRGSGRVPFLVLSWQPIVGLKGLDQCNDSS